MIYRAAPSTCSLSHVLGTFNRLAWQLQQHTAAMIYRAASSTCSLGHVLGIQQRVVARPQQLLRHHPAAIGVLAAHDLRKPPEQG